MYVIQVMSSKKVPCLGPCHIKPLGTFLLDTAHMFPRYFEDGLSWFDASKACRARGASLAYAKDAANLQRVHEYL